MLSFQPGQSTNPYEEPDEKYFKSNQAYDFIQQHEDFIDTTE